MPRYMLDTDTCSYIMRRSPESVLKKLAKIPVSDVCISVITKSELLHGVEVSPKRRQDEAALAAFLRYVDVLDFPDIASSHYAQIRADLMVYEMADGPLWNGQDEIIVREALPDERERCLFFHVRSERPDTPREEHLTHHIYIVEIVNEADGYARQKPLN